MLSQVRLHRYLYESAEKDILSIPNCFCILILQFSGLRVIALYIGSRFIESKFKIYLVFLKVM